MSDGITDARRGFHSSPAPAIIKFITSEKDNNLFRDKLLEYFRDINSAVGAHIKIGEFLFEYVSNSRIDPHNPILKLNGVVFKNNFNEDIKKYILLNNTFIDGQQIDIKISNVEKVKPLDNYIPSCSGVKETFIFRIKVDLIKDYNEIKCNSSGEIIVATKDLSLIYNKIGVEHITSIEKISNGYILE